MDLGTRVPDRCVGDGIPIARRGKRSDEPRDEERSLCSLYRKGGREPAAGVEAWCPSKDAPQERKRKKMGRPVEGVLTSCFL